MVWYFKQIILLCAIVASQPADSVYSPFNRHSLTQQNRTFHKDGINMTMQESFNLTKRDSSNLYKGVNLGGWLVLEGWLTSDSPVFLRIKKDIDGQPEHLMLQRKYGFNKNVPFTESGEYNIMYTYDRQLDYYVQKHRREFITEDDFIEIAKAGFNMVRIPIGYWTFGMDNSGGSTNKDWTIFTQNSAYYLDKAFTWGARNGIKVLVGIHAAKGSQNGNEHSAPSDFNERYWYRYEENRKNTIQLVDKIMQTYKDHEAFLGIGLLNEPWLDNDNELGILKQYYNDAYHLIRGSHASNCIISFSETINGYAPNAWGGFFSNDPNVWHETHIYFVFDDYHKSLNTNQLVADVQTNTRNHMKSIGESRAFVGEWSAAMATDRPAEERGSFLRAQMEVYSNSHWTFWNWKSQESIGYGRGGWSMQEMIRQNILKKEWIGPVANVEIVDIDDDEPPLELLPKPWKTIQSLLDANLKYEIKDGSIPNDYYDSLSKTIRKLVFSEKLCETDSVRMQAYGLMKAMGVVVEYTKMRFAIDSDPSKVDEDSFLTFQTNGDGRSYFKCTRKDKDIECPVPKSDWKKGQLRKEGTEDVYWTLTDQEGFQKLLFKTYGIPSFDMVETSDHKIGTRQRCVGRGCTYTDVYYKGLYILNSNIGHPFSAHDVELYHSYYQKQLADVGEVFMIKHNEMFTCAIDGEDVDCMRHSLREDLVITWKAKDPDAALKALEEYSGKAILLIFRCSSRILGINVIPTLGGYSNHSMS
ncbi:glycoside hydrolase superfamily [Globomyces pollinis-pini]|nr:glycoside hydrolase superfamily [Globomyces pollinis-pini]